MDWSDFSDTQFRETIASLRRDLTTAVDSRKLPPRDGYPARTIAATGKVIAHVGCGVLAGLTGNWGVGTACSAAASAYGSWLDAQVAKIEASQREIDAIQSRITEIEASSDDSSGCFRGSTLIATGTRFAPLESVRVGDIVPGYDTGSAKELDQLVVGTPMHRQQSVISLDFGSESIVCTPRQPFFTGAWTPASQLRPGDKVLRRDGLWQSLQAEPQQAGQSDVYNLEAAPSECYYVGNLQLLVHNKEVQYLEDERG